MSASPELAAPVLVVAGETSGEAHAAGLMQAIEALHPDCRPAWFGSGGGRMRSAGAELLEDVSRLAAIGPWEAASHLGHYWRLYRRILREVRVRRPRLAILIDFPEFNLRLAPRLKALGVTVCYFIGPQVWAWRSGRLEAIRKSVDLMLVIFPFEEEYYRSRGVRAHYVGNPSIDHSLARTPHPSPPQGKPWVALLPGSRPKEVEQIFPILLDAAHWVGRRHSCRFRVIRAPEIEREHLEAICRRWSRRHGALPPLEIRQGELGPLLGEAVCAMIKSGTSTLEATLLGVPFAMVYRISWPSWYLARRLLSTDSYCLTNLIAGRQIVPEFVQREARGEKIGSFILELLEDPERRREMRRGLEEVVSALGRENAYRRAAALVSPLLGRKSAPEVPGDGAPGICASPGRTGEE